MAGRLGIFLRDRGRCRGGVFATVRTLVGDQRIPSRIECRAGFVVVLRWCSGFRLLQRDLLVLKASPALPWISPQAALAVPDSSAAYLGMRYVVEGAQLGSRIIHGHLHAAFGVNLREFGSFWTPGSALQASWPELLKSLAKMESRKSLAAAVHAARLTFRHMERHLVVHKTETT